MMFTQGVSARTNPMKRDRVFHMLVASPDSPTGWRTWCGYGVGREDAPGPYLGVTRSRLCSKCRTLVSDAMHEEMMDKDEAGVFAS